MKLIMHYGYDEHCEHWCESKKHVLADKLCLLLEDFGIKYPCGYRPGWLPYIEVDGLYKVCIRRITHLPDFQRIKLIKKADNIYDDVMFPF